jgi:bifunctional ADP-heptose synthase (sugar kinase/adenylyltransferase)
MRKHILVIGDLYIDHDIFVTDLAPRGGESRGEQRFNVVRRQDTAGGAANSARILSVLNEGETYLWGVVGSSHWGTFRGILEKSQAIDGASRPIQLRGIRDESDPPMNTITRILVVNKEQPGIVQRQFCRYYDMDHVHVADLKRETVLYHLDRIHEEKTQLHAILINDYGRRALTKSLIDAIAAKAKGYRVPLFVDPHVDQPDDIKRYEGIKADAIMPNLQEWCELVGESSRRDYWSQNLNEPDVLRDMAVTSFRRLGNFEYHIIKCGNEGAVLFFPHPEKRHLYALYRMAPVPAKPAGPASQVGCGDVMSAVFALEFPTDRSPQHVLRAIQRANVAVGCYREMPWHQMPRLRDMKTKLGKHDQPRAVAHITKGVLFLPQTTSIDMSECQTEFKGLFGHDQTYRAVLSSFWKDIMEEWTPGSLKSLVLGAPPGTGKTTIMNAIKKMGLSFGIEAKDMTATQRNGGLQLWPPAKFREKCRSLQKARNGQRLLIVVDEALREPTFTFLKENAPTLLNSAHDENLRFLFTSAGFKSEMEEEPEWREFFRRCRSYYLPSLEERPLDIPYIVAARFFQNKNSLNRVDIDGKYLLAATDIALLTPEVSTVCDVADATLNELEKNKKIGEHLSVTLDDLPKSYRDELGSLPKGDFGRYEFRR